MSLHFAVDDMAQPFSSDLQEVDSIAEPDPYFDDPSTAGMPLLEFISPSRGHTSTSSRAPSSRWSHVLREVSARSRWPNHAPRFAPIDLLGRWIPLKTEKDHESFQRKTLLKWQLTCTFVIMIVNFTILIVFMRRYPVSGSVGALYYGNCTVVDQVNAALHVIINILSTLLLGASNSCMQILVAPTREDLKRAHEKGKSMAIGVQDMGNLRYLSKTTALFWTMLAITSGGLHLTWNSAVFKSLPLQSYNVAIVQPNFLSDTRPWNVSSFVEGVSTNGTYSTLQQRLLQASNWENLTSAQCIERYRNSLPGAGTVALVLADFTETPLGVSENDRSSLVDLHTEDASWAQQWWLCRGGFNVTHGKWCGDGGLLPNSTNFIAGWGPNITNETAQFRQPARAYTGRVSYCLSEDTEPVSERCGLHFSVSLMAIVCGFNAVKCLCLLYLWWRIAKTPYKQRHLITIGDAISSYLESPETLESPHLSLNTGITGFRDVERLLKSKHPQARTWVKTPHRWGEAVRRRTWATVFIPAIILIGVAIFLSYSAARTYHHKVGSYKGLLSTGFGRVDSNLAADIPWLGTMYKVVFFANCWQALVAILYVLVNCLITGLHISVEWDSYIRKRQPLRVTQPLGIQRSSYFLSLPFRFVLPLSIGSGILHYLLSESVFLIYPDTYDCAGVLYNGSAILAQHMGISFNAIITSTVCGVVFLLILLPLGWAKHLDGNMPLAGSDSRAIASACYRPEEDIYAHIMPVKYGALPKIGTEPQHCSFTTAKDVVPPESGQQYI